MGQNVKTERNADIVARRKRGETWASIAAVHGIGVSRAMRVYEIEMDRVADAAEMAVGMRASQR